MDLRLVRGARDEPERGIPGSSLGRIASRGLEALARLVLDANKR